LVAKNKVPFRPGMTASVDIVTNTKRDILSVPLGAVTTRIPKSEEQDEDKPAKRNREEDLKEVVFVNVDGKVEMRVVKTGISDFDNIEIVEGLSELEQVITGPYLAVSKNLEAGDLVKAQEENNEDRKDGKRK